MNKKDLQSIARKKIQLIHHTFMSKSLLLRRSLENDKTISPERTHAPMVCHIKSLAMQYMRKDIWINQKNFPVFYANARVQNPGF
jgi:hypothetical protein